MKAGLCLPQNSTQTESGEGWGRPGGFLLLPSGSGDFPEAAPLPSPLSHITHPSSQFLSSSFFCLEKTHMFGDTAPCLPTFPKFALWACFMTVFLVKSQMLRVPLLPLLRAYSSSPATSWPLTDAQGPHNCGPREAADIGLGPAVLPLPSQALGVRGWTHWDTIPPPRAIPLP